MVKAVIASRRRRPRLRQVVGGLALTDPFTMNMEVAAYTAVADHGE